MRFTFLKGTIFVGYQTGCFVLRNDRNTSTALQNNKNDTNIHHIPFNGAKRKNDRNTQTDKDIHTKRELNKKSNNLLLLSSRGDGEWLPNY